MEITRKCCGVVMMGDEARTVSETSPHAKMLVTLGAIIRSSGRQGILLDDMLETYERTTGSPRASLLQGFSPESFVLFLATGLPVTYKALSMGQFRLMWTGPARSLSPVARIPAQVHPESPSHTLPNPFSKQEGLSDSCYVPVYVSHVYSVHDFYIQLRGTHTSLRLEKLMNDLECTYERNTSGSFAISEGNVEKGMACAAPFIYPDGSSDWHRAVVMSLGTEPHLCHVFYVDYGTQGVVARSSLRTLKPEFFELPAQAIRASFPYLEPLAPSGWTAESKAFFLGLVDGDRVLMGKLLGRHGSTHNVSLCDTTRDPEIFVQDALSEEGHAMPRLVSSGWLTLPGISFQHPPKPATHLVASPDGPHSTHRQRVLGHAAAAVGNAQLGLQPVHHPPVPTDSTYPHFCSLIPSGVAQSAALYTAAPSVSPGPSASKGAPEGDAHDDVMSVLCEVLDDQPCPLHSSMVEHLNGAQSWSA